jgi:uncharacterized integral membrane protein
MKLIGWILGAFVALVFILFAIANSATVALGLYPLPWRFELPLYGAVFAALILGFVLGGLGAWLGGRRWRRRARRAEHELQRLEREQAKPPASASAPAGNAVSAPPAGPAAGAP